MTKYQLTLYFALSLGTFSCSCTKTNETECRVYEHLELTQKIENLKRDLEACINSSSTSADALNEVIDGITDFMEKYAELYDPNKVKNKKSALEKISQIEDIFSKIKSKMRELQTTIDNLEEKHKKHYQRLLEQLEKAKDKIANQQDKIKSLEKQINDRKDWSGVPGTNNNDSGELQATVNQLKNEKDEAQRKHAAAVAAAVNAEAGRKNAVKEKDEMKKSFEDSLVTERKKFNDSLNNEREKFEKKTKDEVTKTSAQKEFEKFKNLIDIAEEIPGIISKKRKLAVKMALEALKNAERNGYSKAECDGYLTRVKKNKKFDQYFDEEGNFEN
jgi:DNA repair exonuclease SbcCD ATPase subunit